VSQQELNCAIALNLKPLIKNCFLALIFLIAPIPLFFDFSVFDFYIKKPVDLHELFRIHLGIPVPLALFSYIIYQAYGCLQIKVKSDDFAYLLSCRRNFNFIIAALGGYLFLLGMSLPKVVQIILPLFLMVNMIIPNNPKTRSFIAKYYCIGIALLCSLHLLSIFIKNNYTFLSVDRYMNFGTIFSYQIYQSLVTYINVLSLYSLFFLYEFLSSSQNRLIRLIIIIALIINAGFGGSRMLLADILTFFLVAIAYFFIHNRKHLIILIAIFFTISIFGFNPLAESLHKLELEGTQNRTILWVMAYDEIYPMLDKYMFFGDGSLSYLAHNFFINLIHGVGLIPMTIITFMIVIIFRNIFLYSSTTKSSIFILGAYIMLFLNSFFNTAFTQPLYMSNFLIIVGLIIAPSSYFHAYSEKS